MKKMIISAALLAGTAQAANVAELERKLNTLASEVETLKGTSGNSKVSIGGYGEIVFKDTAGEKEDGTAAHSNANSAQWDTLRNVLYVGYKFNKKWSMMTEIEIEHANSIYTEFAEVRYSHSDLVNFKAGLLLAPVGFINEQHEPPRYFGVNRPELESKIIPTTWRENGLGLYGKKGNFSYNFYVMNSLDGDDFDASGVRSGRQKGAKAKAGRNSFVLRADYSLPVGLTVGATAYVGKTNGIVASGLKHNMYEVHAEFRKAGLQARALYAQNDLDGKKLSAATGNTVADKQSGYYAEVGYDVFNGKDCYLAPYVRYEAYNTTDKVATGLTKDKSKDVTNLTYGLMYKPINDISFKLDYVKNKNEAKTGVDTVNFGIGWQF